MSLASGATLGRYQIIEALGQGGMAVVYKARQPALDRIVALKVIRAGYSEDPEFLERFRREARAVARLDHPNVVQVYDFDEVDGRALLAMQLLDRGTLKERITDAARAGSLLPQEDAARIVEQVAAGLAYAHERGVIHRDVKPANVMFTHDGRAVVTDFGIARMLGGTQLTATGVGIGTPEYMSPEQGQGGVLDARSDVYSLGVVAYELITGQLPFTGDTPFAVVLKHVRDPLPAPSTRNPALPPAFDLVLAKALAKEPAERYASVTDLARDLRSAAGAGLTLPTIRTPPSGPTHGVTEPVAPLATSVSADGAGTARVGLGALVAVALVGVLAFDISPRLASLDRSVPALTPPSVTFAPEPTHTTPVSLPTHPYPVRLTASQVIMPQSELAQASVNITKDQAVGARGWEREFSTSEFWYLQFWVYVLDPSVKGSADVAQRKCDFSFTNPPQPVASEVTAPVIGDAAKACLYHWTTNTVDWSEYITATRNVTIIVAGEPRSISAQGTAMDRMIDLARQQLAIIDRVAPP